MSNDSNINSICHNEIEKGVLDAFIICEPINSETSEVLVDGVFLSISLSKIKNLKGDEKVIWHFEEMKNYFASKNTLI
ncbi:hypothetical protein [Lysinibacillus xylanilyticus]|uniref:hypothetical protein n=1 Tax=Lysinibacillus xylanilyticus TaxID=582475 RepID=UPI003CFC7BCB